MPVAWRVRMAAIAWIAAAVMLLATGCGFSPAIADGTIGCGEGGACPPGFTCAKDGVCYASVGASCGEGPPCQNGQRCEGGNCVCDATSCPDGCCNDSQCEVRSTGACGAAGATCFACDPVAADTCSPQGECLCGAGAACGPGQACVNAQCECNASSCPDGCCDDHETCTPPSLSACGAQGNGCMACASGAADACVGGECTCGSGTSCGAGQRCLNGTCVCDGTSCPTGCCDAADRCQPGNIDGACGSGGSACQSCPSGETCMNGTCSGCAMTCATGCCSGPTCNPRTFGACGFGGSACIACDSVRSDNCSNIGDCSCGVGAECALNQHCVSGSCVCDADSCPSGCCRSGTCVTASSMSACGANGVACIACDPTTADGCEDGACTCGTGGICATGQRCVGGNCVCDSTSCSGCCYGSACEPGNTDQQCGSMGGACAPCSSGTSCSAGACQ